MMCHKKKSTPCMMNPVLCMAVIGFAVIGACGVFCAVKKKAGRLKNAAKKLGCECMEGAQQTAENILEEGMEAAEKMMDKNKKDCSCE